MATDNYFDWLAADTITDWWHDSGAQSELREGIAHGAVGVTTNPPLTSHALAAEPGSWSSLTASLPDQPEERAIALTKGVALNAAEMVRHFFKDGKSIQGYVCAQVNPLKAGDADAMLALARRYHQWAPNISVKLPVTAAGLDVLEECAAEGITTAGTVSFTVPQALAVAERHRKGTRRARAAGVEPGKCYAVIMLGRLDDYIREVAADSRAAVTEDDVRSSALAVAKRAYLIFKQEKYEAVLLVAAARGTYHVTEMAGGELVISVHPKIQSAVVALDPPREERIDARVSPETIRRLMTVREFARAYEPDGMKPEEFITYGVTQRTLSQFIESGWLKLESYGR